MPYVSTGSSGFGGFLGGLSDVIGAAAPIVSTLVGRGGAQPGGAPIYVQPALGDPRPGLQVPGTDLTIQSPLTQTPSMAQSPFRPTMTSAVAQVFFAENPVTRKLTWFGPLGRPILWSRDLAVCRRVKKVARRAKRAGG